MGVDLEELEYLACDREFEDQQAGADTIRAAIAEIRELRARPAVPPWSGEKPTVPGWYWVGYLGPSTIARLGEDGVLTWDNGYRTRPGEGGHCFFAGPIPEPTGGEPAKEGG